MAALYLLNLYYKQVKIDCNFQDLNNLDMSFGSNIFSLEKPDKNKLINFDITRDINVPYILKYKDTVYKAINVAEKEETKKFIDNLLNEKEFKEQEFLEYISYFEKNKNIDSSELLQLLNKLHLFRLNKNIPENLPFIERKNLFLLTAEWKNPLRLENGYLNQNELTEDNIQKEIEKSANLNAGCVFGDLFRKATNLKFTGNCEILLDNGNIAYPDIQ